MSSTPESPGGGQHWTSAPQDVHGTAQPGFGQQQWGPGPTGATGGVAPPVQREGGFYYGHSPVPREETHVTGRRVIQYILDAFVSSIVPYILYLIFNRGHGGVYALLTVILVVLDVLWYLWYWVYRPTHSNGQTVFMQLLGVRVISKGGGEATALQFLVRWVCLIIDDIFAGLVGLVTILVSRHRQRVGDHIAGTLVVRAR